MPYATALVPGAAVALQVHAEQPELAEALGELLRRQRAGLVPVGDVRFELGARVRPDRVADVPFLTGQLAVEVEEVGTVR